MKNQLLKSALLFVFITFFTFGTSRADLLIYYPFDVESGTVVDNQGTQGKRRLGRVEAPSSRVSQETLGRETAPERMMPTSKLASREPLSAWAQTQSIPRWHGSSGMAHRAMWTTWSSDKKTAPETQPCFTMGSVMIAKVTPTTVAGVMILVMRGVVPVGDWTHLTFQFDGGRQGGLRERSRDCAWCW